MHLLLGLRKIYGIFLNWFQKYELENYTQKELEKQYKEIKEGKETWQD
jgi:hypothetical protein